MLEIKLPIGIEDGNGNRFNTVIVDKMRGVDEFNVDQPGIKNNAELAYSALIKRVVLEVPGFIGRKARPEDMLDDRRLPVNQMYSVDREAIILGMLKQSPKTDIDVIMTCRKCGYRLPTEKFDLQNIKINKEFDSGSLTEVSFELEDGLTITEGAGQEATTRVVKTGTIRFPKGADNEAIGSLNNAGERVTSLLFRCVKFDDLSVTRRMIEMLTSADRLKLFKILANEIPRYDLSIKRTCPDCDSKVTEHVNFLDFFGLMQEDDEK